MCIMLVHVDWCMYWWCVYGQHMVNTHGQHMVNAQGYSWTEDKEFCEEFGRMQGANPAAVSDRAKKRGIMQVRLCECWGVIVYGLHINTPIRM